MPMLSSYKVFLPADTYMFKVNIRNTRKRYEICSKSTIKTPVKTDVFIVKFEHISHFVLLFSLLTLSMKMQAALIMLLWRTSFSHSEYLRL